jgi:hypothetical protein
MFQSFWKGRRDTPKSKGHDEEDTAGTGENAENTGI